MAVSNPPKEYTVFINRFAELIDTLNPQHVLRYLISENTISVDDSQRVLAAVTMKDKARKLLEYLAGPIKAGHVRGLWALLEAMEEHGVGAEKELAMIIRSDFIKSENPPIPGTGGYAPVDLPCSRKESFMKLLVGLSDYLDDVEDGFVKRFKLSLKFYSVTDRGVKVVKEVYQSTDNIPDILENLVNHEYITVDNVDLLETVIKSCMADDKRYIQLYQLTSGVVEEYKKSVVLCDTQSSIQRISIASLPVNLQYVIVGTSYPAVTLTHKDVEEVSDAVSSVLSLPKLYFHFCGFEGDLATLCWVLHETDCLKGYQLEVPDYDHYHWLKHLGVLLITVMNDSKCQVVDLQLVSYTGCLLLPKNRDAAEWIAQFYCVPAGYENIIKDLMYQSFHLDYELVTIPIGFESFVSGDDHRLSIRLLAQDLSQCGWTVNTFKEQFVIDKYIVDGVVGIDMPELLPHIPIEVQATGLHHSVRFPGCKVEIEGSCYNQSFMLPSTPALEETEAEVQAELLFTSDAITDYLWTSDTSVNTQYYPVEDWQQQITPVGWHFVKEDHHRPGDRGVY